MFKDYLFKILQFLISTKIYIALAAVLLAFESQIQLGITPAWHPYLFIIFFATIIEYNLNRLVISIKTKSKGKQVFYLYMALCLIGLVTALIRAKLIVIKIIIPLAIITFCYSFPVSLRRIPYAKIFLISLIWSLTTVLLPVMHAQIVVSGVSIAAMLLERFIFVFAVTIPFDIRDMTTDRNHGLKTLPLLMNKNKSLQLARFTLLIFLLISFIHYGSLRAWHIILPLTLSTAITYASISSNRIKNTNLYYYGILDGALLLQGALCLGFYFARA